MKMVVLQAPDQLHPGSFIAVGTADNQHAVEISHCGPHGHMQLSGPLENQLEGGIQVSDE